MLKDTEVYGVARVVVNSSLEHRSLTRRVIQQPAFRLSGRPETTLGFLQFSSSQYESLLPRKNCKNNIAVGSAGVAMRIYRCPDVAAQPGYCIAKKTRTWGGHVVLQNP